MAELLNVTVKPKNRFSNAEKKDIPLKSLFAVIAFGQEGDDPKKKQFSGKERLPLDQNGEARFSSKNYNGESEVIVSIHSSKGKTLFGPVTKKTRRGVEPVRFDALITYDKKSLTHAISPEVLTGPVKPAPEKDNATQAAESFTLDIHVSPETQAGPDTPSSLSRLFLHISYDRASGNATSTRVRMSSHGTLSIERHDYGGQSNIHMQIKNAEGAILHEFSPLKPQKRKAKFSIDATYDLSILENNVRMPAPAQSSLFERYGKFIILGNHDARFDNYHFFAHPVYADDALTTALKEFAHIKEGNPLTSWNEAFHHDMESSDLITRFNFSEGEIKFNGDFSFSHEAEDRELIGWVWLLSGKTVFFGFQHDPSQKPIDRDIIIPLRNTPELTLAQENESRGSDKTGAACCQPVPMDVEEQQLIAEADLFSDDPGTHCEPFKNPNRILGEKRFHTILRVEQPEIQQSTGADSWVEDLSNLSIWRQPGIWKKLAKTSKTTPDFTMENPSLDNLRNIGLFGGPWVLGNNTQNTNHNSPDLTRRHEVSGDNEIDWEENTLKYQALSVAGGHILEWSMRWRANGYSLGNVAHTLGLAPRQTRRIVRVDWERSERSIRQEETSEDDEVRQETLSDRDYSNTVSANLDEWSKGRSRSSVSSVAGGFGFAGTGFVLGGGGGHSRADSSSSQEGGRKAAAREEQSLRDAIRQYGDSLRQLESTVVVETQQDESVEGISEIIRNPNYCHSLTIIYYEILRHLRIDTELAGVRECLFVPFKIKPFVGFDRAIRYRNTLSKYMKDRSLRWVMPYLEDAATEFANSEIPEGPRHDHQLTSLRGSLYIRIGIERPNDPETEQELAKEALEAGEEGVRLERRIQAGYKTFSPFIPLFTVPILRVVETIEGVDGPLKDRVFQREFAPGAAREWCNNLTLTAGHDMTALKLDSVDFTMAGTYGFNQIVRVDFTISSEEAAKLTRAILRDFRVEATHNLPAGSTANLERVTLHYTTAYDKRIIRSEKGFSDDLVHPTSGEFENEQARVTFHLSKYDTTDMRVKIAETADQVIAHLNNHIYYYHKAIWWNMDADELYTLLDGFAYNADGRSIASVVERRPIGIMGNMMVFRVAPGIFLGVGEHETYEDLLNSYKDNSVISDPMRVSLPTGGLYAQALMDHCNACEEHEGTVDWVLDDKDPELEEVASLLGTRRAAPQNLTPTEFSDPIINIQNAPTAPAPTGLDGVLGAVGNANAFRDMTGLEGTQKNALSGLQTAANLATNFGNAANTQKMLQIKEDAAAAKNLKSFVDTVDKLKNEGKIDPQIAEDAKNVAAMRKARGSGTDVGNSVTDRALQLAKEQDEDVNIEAEDSKGKVKISKKGGGSRRGTEKYADYSVIELSPTKILFMNFLTDKADLRNEHKKFLAKLVGRGIKAENIASIIGHASTSADTKHNLELGQDRAESIRNHFNTLSKNIAGLPGFNTEASQGEKFSYRQAFKDNELVRKAPSPGHKNDPVEKAVMLTLTKAPDDVIKRIARIKLEITGKIVIIGNIGAGINAQGQVVIFNTQSLEVHGTLNVNKSEVNTEVNEEINISNESKDETNVSSESNSEVNVSDESQQTQHTITKSETVNIGGNHYSIHFLNNLKFLNFSNNTTEINIPILNNLFNGNTVEVGGGGASGAGTGEKEEEAKDEWLIKFHAPSLEGGRSIRSVIEETANILVGLTSTPNDAKPGFDDIFLDILDAGAGAATDILLTKLGITGVALQLLDKVRFGTLTFKGAIKEADDSKAEVKGTFDAPGICIGTVGQASSATILGNSNYKTGKKLKLSEWNDQTGFIHFAYVNIPFANGAEALANGLDVLIRTVLASLDNKDIRTIPLNTLKELLRLLRIDKSRVEFKAFSDDPKTLIATGNAAGFDLQLMAITRGRLSFSPD